MAFWLEHEQDGQRQKYPFDAPTISIGRDKASDFLLDHPTVSRQHARIVASGHGYRLVVLSTSGLTAVNGAPVSGEVPIQDGATLNFGQFAFTFRSDAPKAVAPASGGFGAPASGGFGAPASGGFGAPASGGFGAPASGGFGAPASGGFGAPASGGFGTPSNTPASGGFGAPASGGFGAPANAPAAGFGAPANAPAAGGFGAPAAGGFGTPAAGGFGAPASGGFGAPAAPAAGGFGAPASGGFGQPTNTPAAGGFGAPAAGGFGAPAAGGFGAPASGGFGQPFGAPQQPAPKDDNHITSWDEIAQSADAPVNSKDAKLATDFERLEAAQKKAKEKGKTNPIAIVLVVLVLGGMLAWLYLPQDVAGPAGPSGPVEKTPYLVFLPGEIDCIGEAECLSKAQQNFRVANELSLKVEADIRNRFDAYHKYALATELLKKAGMETPSGDFATLEANRDKLRGELDADFQLLRVKYHNMKTRKMYTEMVAILNEVQVKFPHKGARENLWAVQNERALKDENLYPTNY